MVNQVLTVADAQMYLSFESFWLSPSIVIVLAPPKHYPAPSAYIPGRVNFPQLTHRNLSENSAESTQHGRVVTNSTSDILNLINKSTTNSSDFNDHSKNNPAANPLTNNVSISSTHCSEPAVTPALPVLTSPYTNGPLKKTHLCSIKKVLRHWEQSQNNKYTPLSADG